MKFVDVDQAAFADKARDAVINSVPQEVRPWPNRFSTTELVALPTLRPAAAPSRIP